LIASLTLDYQAKDFLISVLADQAKQIFERKIAEIQGNKAWENSGAGYLIIQSTEQIGMGSCTFKNYSVSVKPVDQKPIRFQIFKITTKQMVFQFCTAIYRRLLYST
jgi:hypothetical protein